MITSEQPTPDAPREPPDENGALAAWFDDPDVSEEVQALRAWVAGLSNELADARRERDEMQQALYAALAEVARLRGALAQADAGPLAPAEPAAPGAPTPPPAAARRTGGPVAEPSAEPPAAAAEPAGAEPAPVPPPVSTPAGSDARRVRLVAGAVLLILAAAVVLLAGPRLVP